MPYALWSGGNSWCEYQLTTEADDLPAIRSLFEDPWFDGSQTIERVPIDLVPEPDSPRCDWSVSVRGWGQTLGYLDPETAQAWAPILRRVIASEFVPRTNGKIFARNYDSWDGGDEFSANVYINLGQPNEALPINDPPTLPYTLLPRSSIVQVTKEDLHTDVLLKFVPQAQGGHGVLFVTLHEQAPAASKSKPHVEVRIDDECIGQLTPQMSTRFLPMVRHLRDRGLITACWGDITGSAVAAEVRINGIKANEATDEVLNGFPVQLPRLVPELTDPMAYDLTAAAQLMRPNAPVKAMSRPVPPEPEDGAVVRFSRSNGRYAFAAVRRGHLWQTTSTSDWGAMREVMSWSELGARGRNFEQAIGWSDVGAQQHSLTSQKLAVVRFTIQGIYLAAINVADDGSSAGDWYTTITEAAEASLPFGDYASWSDIALYGQHIQVVTAWQGL